MPAEEYWGMQLVELTPALAQRYRVAVDAGLLVTAAPPAGFAHESGVRQLDVITHVGEQPVKTLAEFRALLEPVDPDTGVTLKLHTQGLRRQVGLRRQ